jgi:hypothetical protein
MPKSRIKISRYEFEILKSRDFPISNWENEILKMQKFSRLKINLENFFLYRDPKSRDGEYDPETILIFFEPRLTISRLTISRTVFRDGRKISRFRVSRSKKDLERPISSSLSLIFISRYDWQSRDFSRDHLEISKSNL